jgi:hypothetical protein
MASAHTKSHSAIGKSTSTGHTSTKGRLLACACAAANDSSNYAYGRLPPAHFTSSTTVRSSMYDNFHTYCGRA